jgi:hypothetical protein
MIAAVHAEWFADLNTGAYTVALDGGKGEAHVVEEWVTNEQEAWVYASLQGTLAALQARPDVDPSDIIVIGDRGDLSKIVRRAFAGRLGEALAQVNERWPGVQHRCKTFADRARLRSVLRNLVETVRAKEAA